LVRFKQLAGQMVQAFGVQRQVPADMIPMGTSAVFDRFSPAEPQPTLREEVRQSTTIERARLDTFREQLQTRMDRRIEALKFEVEEALRLAIDEGGVRVERDGSNVLVRIDEQGTFPSGSAEVTQAFAELLLVMAATLSGMPGGIVIEGHTDDIPIYDSRFRSNWDLSAMRSATVANLLLEDPELDPNRLTVMGHADTRPLVPNDSEVDRARNRRVEITLQLGDAVEREVHSAMPLSAVE
ncbi:MAG: OmpA family protein, partial [Halomonas sp.]|uniref:OmpA family protein n=1 Tax=Halomonas sp. TaxID=1486246 RepID=UPI0019D9F126